jgi:acyl carrier protein
MTVSKESIARFLTETLFDGQAVDFDEDLLLSGKVDSLGVMSLVAFVEENIDSRISASDITIENFESINAITNFLEGMKKV